jgi:hypothetical protein
MAAASMAPAARSSVTSPDPPALLPDLRPVPPDLLPRDLDVSGGRQRRRRGSAWARFASAATRPRRVRLPCISVGASGSGSGGGFRRDRCGARVLPFVAMAAGGVLRRGGFHGRRAAWWTVSWVWRYVGGVMVVRPAVASLDVYERCYGGVASDGQGRRTRDAMEAYLVARDAYLLCG